MFVSALLVLAAAASPALANVYVTSPVGSTTWPANQQQTISWKDDGASPSLKEFGPSKVSVYVGNQQQQTQVQAIADNVDVSTTSSVVFTPEASVGENGAYYFIRIESLSLKDANSPQFPALAFSSKYTMSGMTGTFSADVKAQIAGASTGNSPSASSAPSTAPSTSKATTTSASTNAANATKTGTQTGTGTAAASNKTNAAISLPASAITCVAGVAIAVVSAMFI